jgi:hypothetical protein
MYTVFARGTVYKKWNWNIRFDIKILSTFEKRREVPYNKTLPPLHQINK